VTRRIVVAGAGVIGLTAAALLDARAKGVEVVVLDGADAPPADSGDIDLRVSAIAPGSEALLTSVGAWPYIDASRLCDYERMVVWDALDAEDSPRALRFEAAEFGVGKLGTIVENAAIQRALVAALHDTDVTLRYGTSVDIVDLTQRTLTLSSGSSLEFDLLVGADGLKSTIRRLVDIDTREKDYEQVAVVTHLAPERPHQMTAWQRHLPSGPIALLPLSDGRVSTVWSTDPETAAAALDADDDELSARITEASGGVLGHLRVAGPRGHFPLRASHATRYVDGGVALIGDAAHGIHPMAGQGANLGLRDADALSEVVAAAIEATEHPGSKNVLRRYERQRRGDNATMQNGLTALNELFANRSMAVGELRRYGMQFFNAFGPARRIAMRTALGQSLD